MEYVEMSIHGLTYIRLLSLTNMAENQNYIIKLVKGSHIEFTNTRETVYRIHGEPIYGLIQTQPYYATIWLEITNLPIKFDPGLSDQFQKNLWNSYEAYGRVHLWPYVNPALLWIHKNEWIARQLSANVSHVEHKENMSNDIGQSMKHAWGRRGTHIGYWWESQKARDH
jgi:hypothetical protein